MKDDDAKQFTGRLRNIDYVEIQDSTKSDPFDILTNANYYGNFPSDHICLIHLTTSAYHFVAIGMRRNNNESICYIVFSYGIDYFRYIRKNNGVWKYYRFEFINLS